MFNENNKYHMGWIAPSYVKITENENHDLDAKYINLEEANNIINNNLENTYIFRIRPITDKKSEYLQYPFEKYYKKTEINNSNDLLRCYIRNNIDKNSSKNDPYIINFVKDIFVNKSAYKNYVELSSDNIDDKDKINVSIKKLS